jgi:hypothetical protein
VKPNNSGAGRILMQQVPGGGWNATNVTLGMLIRMANQLQDNQIVGGPKWLVNDQAAHTSLGRKNDARIPIEIQYASISDHVMPPADEERDGGCERASDSWSLQARSTASDAARDPQRPRCSARSGFPGPGVP